MRVFMFYSYGFAYITTYFIIIFQVKEITLYLHSRPFRRRGAVRTTIMNPYNTYTIQYNHSTEGKQ